METITHCFEEQGLGLAPFTYLRCVDLGFSCSACEYCNTSIRYQFFLKSADGKMFFVGSDCIYKSGDAGLIVHAKRERSRIAKEQREAKNAKKAELRRLAYEKRKKDQLDTFISNNANLLPVFDWAKQAGGIAQDIYGKLEQWGTITDRQIEFLTSLYEQSKVQTNKTPCPNGKITIVGVIVGLKYVDTQFGLQEKMTIESDNGYRVYGSVPKCLNGIDKGNKVQFVATVQQSNTDQFFGFFSRPTQAVLLQ